MSSFFVNATPPSQASNPKSIKRSNRNLILSFMDFEEPITGSEIAEAAKLSKTTISKTLNAFHAMGLITSVGKGVSTEEGGKKPELFTLNADYKHVMVIQLSELPMIECTILNLACKVIHTERIPTEPTITYEETIDKSARLAAKLLKESGLTADDIYEVLVSCEGVVDAREGIIRKPAHHLWNPDAPISRDLGNALGFPARISIDNVCRYSGYAELMLPENRRYTNLFVIWNDELVGGVLLVDRQMVQGRSGLVGEVGHMTIDPDSDVRCSCGALGCFEPLASCNSLLDEAYSRRQEYPESTIAEKAEDGTLILGDVFDAANEGDLLARRLIDRVVRYYAILIRNITSLYDPQKVILQGVYASAGAYFYETLNEKITEMSIRGIKSDTIVAPSSYKSGISRTIGPAYYAATQFLNSDIFEDIPKNTQLRAVKG